MGTAHPPLRSKTEAVGLSSSGQSDCPPSRSLSDSLQARPPRSAEGSAQIGTVSHFAMARACGRAVRRGARRIHGHRRGRDRPRGHCQGADALRNSRTEAHRARRRALPCARSPSRAGRSLPRRRRDVPRPRSSRDFPRRCRSVPAARARRGAGADQSGRRPTHPGGDCMAAGGRHLAGRGRRVAAAESRRRRRTPDGGGGRRIVPRRRCVSRAGGALQSAGAARARQRARFARRRFSRPAAAACHARAALRRGWHARRNSTVPADQSRGLGRWATGPTPWRRPGRRPAVQERRTYGREKS